MSSIKTSQAITALMFTGVFALTGCSGTDGPAPTDTITTDAGDAGDAGNNPDASPDAGPNCQAVPLHPFAGLPSAISPVIRSGTSAGVSLTTNSSQIVIPYLDGSQSNPPNLRARIWDSKTGQMQDILAFNSSGSSNLIAQNTLAFFTDRWNFVIAGQAPTAVPYQTWATSQSATGGNVGAATELKDYANNNNTTTLIATPVDPANGASGLLAGFFPAYFKDRLADGSWSGYQQVANVGACAFFDSSDHTLWAIGTYPGPGGNPGTLFHRQGAVWNRVPLAGATINGYTGCARASGSRAIIGWGEGVTAVTATAKAAIVDLVQQKTTLVAAPAFPIGTPSLPSSLEVNLAMSPNESKGVILYYDRDTSRVWKSVFDGTQFSDLTPVLGNVLFTSQPVPFYDPCTGKAMIYAATQATTSSPQDYSLSEL